MVIVCCVTYGPMLSDKTYSKTCGNVILYVLHTYIQLTSVFT